MRFNVYLRYVTPGDNPPVYIVVKNIINPTRRGSRGLDYLRLENFIQSLSAGSQRTEIPFKSIEFLKAEVSKSVGENEKYEKIEPTEELEKLNRSDITRLIGKAIDKYKSERRAMIEKIREEKAGKPLEKYEACKLLVCNELDKYRDQIIETYKDRIEMFTTIKKFTEKFNEIRREWLSETCGNPTSVRIRAIVIFLVACQKMSVPMTMTEIGEFSGTDTVILRRYARDVGYQTPSTETKKAARTMEYQIEIEKELKKINAFPSSNSTFDKIEEILCSKLLVPDFDFEIKRSKQYKYNNGYHFVGIQNASTIQNNSIYPKGTMYYHIVCQPFINGKKINSLFGTKQKAFENNVAMERIIAYITGADINDKKRILFTENSVGIIFYIVDGTENIVSELWRGIWEEYGGCRHVDWQMVCRMSLKEMKVEMKK